MVDRSHPDVRNLVQAIGRAKEPIAWVEIGAEDWNELCRALGQPSDADGETMFLGYALRIGDFPHGARAVTAAYGDNRPTGERSGSESP